MTHRAGFVNILGAPNVGKSTLMNAITGERLSIITPKVQTTRHRILGIVNGEDYQIVFSDTPGIIDPKYKLQESMMEFVNLAMEDADIYLLVVTTESGELMSSVVERFKNIKIPVIVCINKIDLTDQPKVEQSIKEWKDLLPNADVIPVSALHSFNIQSIKERIIHLLPESPPYFDGDELTDRNLRFFVSEIIREKILLQYKQEIPYSCEVVIDEFLEGFPTAKIYATIVVSRDSQKAILIGQGGKAIKRLGIVARKSIEEFIEQKVHLELKVKVVKDWRDNPNQLRWFGYTPS